MTLLTRHLGYPIPSPAILAKLGQSSRSAVATFAAERQIPMVRFGKGDRKIDVMRPYLARQAATGVAAIGIAQEFQNVFDATERDVATGVPRFSFHKADRRVSCYYFYLWDDHFGPAFIKICACSPYPIKVWVNGHDRTHWAIRELDFKPMGQKSFNWSGTRQDLMTPDGSRGEVPVGRVLFRATFRRTTRASFPACGSPVIYAVIAVGCP